MHMYTFTTLSGERVRATCLTPGEKTTFGSLVQLYNCSSEVEDLALPSLKQAQISRSFGKETPWEKRSLSEATCTATLGSHWTYSL